MIIPIRCFSCNNTLANKWEKFNKLVAEGMTPKQALNRVGLHRQCCRTIIKQHVNIIDDLLMFDYYDHKIPIKTN